MKSNNKYKIVVHIFLILGGISMLFPFVWMMLTSLKSFGETITIPPTIFPEKLMWSNFVKVGDTLPFGMLYFNTIALIFIRVVCAVVTCSLAGYAFGRIKFPGRNILFSLVLIQMMLPSQIFIIPQYLMVAKLGWLNSIAALVFPGIVSSFGTFLLRQSFMGLPKELEEAAIIDGCNHFTIFSKIMLPLVKNSLLALTVFTALFAYKELMWPLIVNTSIDKMTLSSAITSFKGQYSTDFTLIMAASFIAMWPMFILYMVFHRQFTSGIAFTGTKG